MPTLRLIDANANRAREAMRTLEDAARFLLDDAGLSGEAKAMRHALAAVMDGVPVVAAYRDTPGDVGTAITTEAERSRADVHAVTVAAGKRLSEALRSLEEFGKTVDRFDAGAVEVLRYRGYELERRVVLALRPRVARQWRCCVLLTEAMCVLPWREVLTQAVDAGADCVQVREKAMEGGPLCERVREVVAMVGTRATVIVNDRVDVALAGGAHGVHLGQTDLNTLDVRKQVGDGFIVGVSTHELAQAERAHAEGADCVGVGPVFASSTKPRDFTAGLAYVREVAEWGRLPHLAIGGITPGNVGEVVAAGGQGVAVSSVVCVSDTPGEVVRRLVAGLVRSSESAGSLG